MYQYQKTGVTYSPMTEAIEEANAVLPVMIGPSVEIKMSVEYGKSWRIMLSSTDIDPFSARHLGYEQI